MRGGGSPASPKSKCLGSSRAGATCLRQRQSGGKCLEAEPCVEVWQTLSFRSVTGRVPGGRGLGCAEEVWSVCVLALGGCQSLVAL